MRYAAPVAMPAGLGEWLGAELEARGVEAASLYARAVLSILLHSEVAEAEAELDSERDHTAWNPRAALELELRLERHSRETRRGRPAAKKNFPAAKSAGGGGHGHHPKRSCNIATNKNQSGAMVKRRPHSWNGDEEALKKCAAIECLLSATDDGQWGPVEKLVDELCSRLKLLQLEQDSGVAKDGRAKQRWATGGSAPECVKGDASPPSDSDSFTSVSSPEGDQDVYRQAFPPLECFSDSDQGTSHPVVEPIWNVRKSGKGQSRVRFLRMQGTRLSPPSALPPLLTATVHSYGESCTSEAYFGDCSRDSSLERAPTPPPPPQTAPKGRLYERGADFGGDALDDKFSEVLNDAYESFYLLHEKLVQRPVMASNEEQENVGACPTTSTSGAQSFWSTDWSAKSTTKDGDTNNIWAPIESDWAMMGTDLLVTQWPTASFASKVPADAAVQLSLALINHHPERSGFTPVHAKSLMLHQGMPPLNLPRSSKLIEWLTSKLYETVGQQQQQHVDCDEKEVEDILNEHSEVAVQPKQPEEKAEEAEEEPENLLTSPKTHFCPIQQEGDVEVQVSDGATFDVDAQPEEVHFLRSPSGALYLPECEENGDGWKGWAKYMVYKTPTSPSPLLTLEAAVDEQQRQDGPSRSATPFTLKFRVVQTEKCCQTDSRTSAIDPDKIGTGPLAISSPFVSAFPTAATTDLLGAGDVWKFDAEAVVKELMDEEDRAKDNQLEEVKELSDGKEEEVDGLLNEVWNVAAALNGGDEREVLPDVVEPQVEETVVAAVPELPEGALAAVRIDSEEVDLDELWNPFMDETGEEQVDVCEWVPQTYMAEEGCAGGDQWSEEDMVNVAESWPPPNIPVEYLDDDFFEEIYGSLDSMKTSEALSIGGTGKNSRRRRRRTSQKQQPPRRPKRPCSFFVEGECRRPDCKFSHDLGSITCRFWIESSCFKGDECPFLHGIAAKESDRNPSCSDVELSESCGSADDGHAPPARYGFRERGNKAAKKFQFDLEADFPSLGQVHEGGHKIARNGPIVSHSRPIAITQGFAAADQTSTTAGSSLENGAGSEGGSAVCLKRRRKRFPSQRANVTNLIATSSESSPGETVSIINLSTAGKRSRKLAKVTTLCAGSAATAKREKAVSKKKSADVLAVQPERRRTKSEHDSGCVGVVSTGGGGGGGTSVRSRLSSSYKEG